MTQPDQTAESDAAGRDPMAAAQAVADAVLYEGYLLYPYRASAAKNQLRWQFGVLVPPAFAAAGAGEHAAMRTECLFTPGEGALVHVRLRFLQLVTRPPHQDAGVDPAGSWDEAVPREVDAVLPVARLFGPGWLTPFTVPGGEGEDPETGVSGSRQELRGELLLRAEPAGPDGLLRLRTEVSNTSTWPSPECSAQEWTRTRAVRHSLVATHTLLAVTTGEFHSLLDPPQAAQAAAEACQNHGTWPVLVGQPPERDAMLSAPIILYDYPAVAPESPGELYDGTEIDELLSLRTLTLTEEEKRQARATDPRAAELIDRVDRMPPEVLNRLHGAIRSLGPAGTPRPSGWRETDDPPTYLEIAGQRVAQGSRVRLAPGAGNSGNRRTDAQDMFLVDRLATVQKVLHDVDGGQYLAVTVDDDPGKDLHAAHGRFRYFAPNEVVPLPARGDAASPPQEGSPLPSSDVSGTPSGGAEGAPRVLVAGIGNIFLGDDGFGVELARRLAESAELPGEVRVADYGIGGVHLAYDLLAGYRAVILLDATPRGEPPGTVSVLEVGEDVTAVDPGEAVVAMDAHGMQPDRVLGLVRTLGGDLGRVLVVGCEPECAEPGIGLSRPVAAAVEQAVPMVQELVVRALAELGPQPAGVGKEGS